MVWWQWNQEAYHCRLRRHRGNADSRTGVIIGSHSRQGYYTRRDASMASLSSVDLQALTRQVRAILDDPHAPAPSTGTPTLVQSQTAWLELPHTEGYETHTTPLRPSTGGCRACGPGGGLALSRCLCPPARPDRPGQCPGRGGTRARRQALGTGRSTSRCTWRRPDPSPSARLAAPASTLTAWMGGLTMTAAVRGTRRSGTPSPPCPGLPHRPGAPMPRRSGRALPMLPGAPCPPACAPAGVPVRCYLQTSTPNGAPCALEPNHAYYQAR